ncbi:SCO family protein [Gynurincola endophyticus]|jgi:protein SCO1/2|uniref:SCO family protein n=1 Tax=Gynurincola endophyticus TaxID=2479004 RepID=UPI001F26F1F2|nr:SCO family protein [Gynurincola endophyticus]
MKKALLYFGFFIVIAIGFYFAMTKLIPGYGIVKLPVLSYVQPFEFYNQDGKRISNRDLEGKVYVSEFFFTTCKSICPIMNTNMLDLYTSYKDSTQFRILSHTCDPETDTVDRLKVYADSLGVDTDKWIFLTGRKDSLYNAARNSYLLDDPKNNLKSIEEQFMHTQFFALVDKAGRVRKVYDGLKKEELKELHQDVKKLIEEPVDQTRFVNNIFGN